MRARAALARAQTQTPSWSIPLLHLYFVWALTMFDFQFYLAAYWRPLIYIVYLGYPPLLLMLAFRAPALMATGRGWMWYPPLLMLLAVAGLTVFLADNKVLAKGAFQNILIYYSIAVATAVYVKSARQAIPIIALLLLQFVWYGLFARTQGRVPWHPTLSNYDGFASMIVQGVGLFFFVAMAARSRKMRLLFYLLAAYCVVGVVASFARAAFLVLIALVGYIWWRSPRKMVTSAAIAVAGILVLGAASLIFEPGFFWNEILSAFEEGATEGTGEHRWELWKVGFKVWLQSPIFGVGGNNFGAFAANHFRYGELEAFPNPGRLYGFNLHNAYMQVLSEFGFVGLLTFGWALWYFQRLNREMRDPESVRRFAEQTGGKWDLRYLAYGLEAANIANALCALFYASLYSHAFYTVWAANLALWAVTRGAVEHSRMRPGRSQMGALSPAPGTAAIPTSAAIPVKPRRRGDYRAR